MFLRVHFLAHAYAAKGPTSAASNATNDSAVFNATGIRALLVQHPTGAARAPRHP